jgi:uncharacterized surface protein with fasciclin (FAS1) repeats
MSQFSRRSLITAGSGLSLAATLGFARPVLAQSDNMMAHPETAVGDAYSIMASMPDLTSWVTLIDAGGLQAQARAPVPYTIFPVTNAVFDANPQIAKQLLGYLSQSGTHNAQDAFPDTTLIVKLVRSHVLRGKHFPSEMESKKVTVTTVAGTPMTIDATTSPVAISWTSAANGRTASAQLVDPPIVCSNAVIYVINNLEYS